MVGSRLFLFDAGTGVERRLNAAGLPINGATALFITHLHSDHTLGLPDLILTSWVMGRRTPLVVYGPRGLGSMTRHIVAAWSEDIAIRTNGLEHETPGGYRVTVHEIRSGVVYDSGGVKVTAIPGSARKLEGGIRLPDRHSRSQHRDLRRHATLRRAAQAARGVDVLIHEAYPVSALIPENRPGGQDWPRYLQTFHTSTVELGQMAASTQPGLLILYHIVQGRGDAQTVADVRRGGYTGRLAVGKDLQRY